MTMCFLALMSLSETLVWGRHPFSFTALAPACTLSLPCLHKKRWPCCMPHSCLSRSPLREILGKLRQRPSFIAQSTSMLKTVPLPSTSRHSWKSQPREGIARSREGCPLPQRLNLQHRGEIHIGLRIHYLKNKTQTKRPTKAH